ncbi:MAG: hypothetical protein ABW065_04430 [Solirubrobacterales bacterium]
MATLTPAIERVLGGGEGEGPLRAWWRRRDRESLAMYWFAKEMGDSNWAPLLSETFNSRFASDPEVVVRFLRVLGRDLPPSQLLSAGEVASVVAETFRNNPGKRRRVVGEASRIGIEEMRRTALRASGLRRPR